MNNDDYIRSRANAFLIAYPNGMTLEAMMSFARGIQDLHVSSKSVTALTAAAFDCGTDEKNPDTCGVCHKHFAECEADQRCVGDDVDEHDIPKGREPACAGARIRAVLLNSQTSTEPDYGSR